MPAGGGEKLRALLTARDLSRHVALLDERGFVHGEWFADYALAVLSPSSGCSSEPSWVAWVAWQPAQPEAAATPTLTLTLTLTLTPALALTLTLTLPLTRLKLEQNLVEFLNTPATTFLSAAESGDLVSLP